MKIYLEPRDIWIGYYRGDTHHYVCPLPTLVIRWQRRLAFRRHRHKDCAFSAGWDAGYEAGKRGDEK
jgi:hypothetical protein